MINRRITVAVAAVGALTLAACGSGGDDGSSSDAALQVLTFVSAEQMQPVVDAFAEVNPDVQIEVQTVPFDDLNSVVQSRVGSGDENVDVFMVDQPRLATLADQGMLLDLTEQVTIEDDVILPEALEASTYEGRLYALPVQTSTQLLFYNQDLLEAAGAEVPGPDPQQRKTWEQVVDDGRAAQDDGAQWGLLFEQGATPFQVLPLVQSLGGGTGLSGEDNLTPELLTPEWGQAMSWWHEVHADEVVPRGMGFGVTTETFAAGNAAYFLGGPWNIDILGGQDLEFTWGVTAHPYFADGAPVTPTGSFGWGVNPHSDATDAAIELVEFVATTAEGSLAVAEGDPNLPAHIDALDTYLSDEAFRGGIADLIHYELQNTAELRPITTGYIAYETILGATLEDIRNGAAPDAALEQADQELTEQLARP